MLFPVEKNTSHMNGPACRGFFPNLSIFLFRFLTGVFSSDTLAEYPFFSFMRVLVILQVIVAVLLIISILLQSRGSGMGASAPGGNYYAKRGFEKFLLYASAGLAVLFVFLAGLNAYLSERW
jgi:protein translocase SecG subunit